MTGELFKHGPGKRDRGVRDRYGIGTDAGLGAHPLGDREGRLHDAVEIGAGNLLVKRRPIRVFQLAQDLAPLFVQMKPVSQEDLLALYKQHVRVGQLGLVVSLAAWSWSLVSSISILIAPQSPAIQPPCPN